VTVTPWPIEPGQMPAYADSLKRHRNEARWIAFLDLDEFLFSPTGRSVSDVLREFETHPAVAVNWRTYGTSGHAERPEGLVTANYVWRVRDDLPMNEHVKSVVYPRKASTWVENPHMFRLYGEAVGEDRRPVNTAFRSPPTADLLRINHYWSRSVADLQRKWGRPDVGTGERGPRSLRFFADALEEKDGVMVPRDEVRDETVLRYLPALREALAGRQSEAKLARSPIDATRRAS
jgi:hypothetical protein